MNPIHQFVKDHGITLDAVTGPYETSLFHEFGIRTFDVKLSFCDRTMTIPFAVYSGELEPTAENVFEALTTQALAFHLAGGSRDQYAERIRRQDPKASDAFIARWFLAAQMSLAQLHALLGVELLFDLFERSGGHAQQTATHPAG